MSQTWFLFLLLLEISPASVSLSVIVSHHITLRTEATWGSCDMKQLRKKTMKRSAGILPGNDCGITHLIDSFQSDFYTNSYGVMIHSADETIHNIRFTIRQDNIFTLVLWKLKWRKTWLDRLFICNSHRTVQVHFDMFYHASISMNFKQLNLLIKLNIFLKLLTLLL